LHRNISKYILVSMKLQITGALISPYTEQEENKLATEDFDVRISYL